MNEQAQGGDERRMLLACYAGQERAEKAPKGLLDRGFPPDRLGGEETDRWRPLLGSTGAEPVWDYPFVGAAQAVQRLARGERRRQARRGSGHAT